MEMNLCWASAGPRSTAD